LCDIARSRMDFRFRWKSGRAADITSKTGFGPIPVSRRIRSIRPRFVPEFPLERNDRHRAVRWPKPAITQGGHLPLRTRYLTDLGRSKVQEPDRLCAARLGDPPSHARDRESPPLDTLHRLRGRERDHATLRCTPPALRSQMHLRESPNRLGLCKQRPWPESRG
jgi:hypothetical protein